MMKKFIFILTLFYTAYQALSLEQDFICPEDDCEISQCLYSNPNNCSTYWQCSLDGDSYLRNCPDGLEFNDFIKVCDWPSDQTCRPGLQPTPKPTLIPTTTEESADTTTDTTTTEQSAEETSTEGTTEQSTETKTNNGTTEQTTATNTDETVTTTPSELLTTNDEVSL